MKKLLLTLITTSVILLITVSCEQFTVSYDRVESDEFRLLDFKYERLGEDGLGTNSADIAPGDTLLLTAVFAGKRPDPGVDLDYYLDSIMLKWWISFNVIRDLMGNTTIVDSVELLSVPGVKRVDSKFLSPSGKAMSAAFKIPIPKDIMRKSGAIPDNWIKMLPANMRGDIPEPFASWTKDDMVDMVEYFIDNPPQVDGNNQLIGNDPNLAFLRMGLQFLTIPIRVMASVKMPPGRLPHTIRSGHNIRYNRHFSAIDARVNNNPEIKEIIAFKVKGDIGNFHDKSGREYCTLFVRKDPVDPYDGKLVIPVEDGYSYFLEAVTEASRDTARTLGDKLIVEEHNTFWMFHLEPGEISGVKRADYMDIENSFFASARIHTPGDERIKTFTLWATVTDNSPNEFMRPNGGTLAEVDGKFVYGAGGAPCNWVIGR